MLAGYLTPYIADKKEVKVADIGSGPSCRIGQSTDEVTIYPMDRRDYGPSIEVQNMEQLTYSDNFFDLVHCSNALDHTPNAQAAVKEMIRVCKPSGWIYIQCWLDQHTTSRKIHYWDVKENGVFVSETGKFDLKDMGFKIQFIYLGTERRYNYIIATLQK